MKYKVFITRYVPEIISCDVNAESKQLAISKAVKAAKSIDPNSLVENFDSQVDTEMAVKVARSSAEVFSTEE